MGPLTENRPKCLVSIGGQPLLHSVSRAFGNQLQVIVIADYKADVLEKYLENFPPPFDYKIVRASGSGTASGLEEARKVIDGEGFSLVWSDLLFTETIDISGIRKNTLGVTKKNRCRWSVFDGKIIEEPNSLPNHFGIPGIFFFPEPDMLPTIPNKGEFVRFLSELDIDLQHLEVESFKEIGSFRAYREERDSRFNSRFFNDVYVKEGIVFKEVRNESFRHLLSDEINWYKFVSEKYYTNIPEIISYEPLSMSLIDGFHPYGVKAFRGAKDSVKGEIVGSILHALEDLHDLGSSMYSDKIINEVYVKKTIERIGKVANVIPYADSETFTVEGKKVMNLLHPSNQRYIGEIVRKVMRTKSDFRVIHGDPTFSNVLIEKTSGNAVFIDPRGYFGSLKIYGDPMYDYAKLYYSAIGNYDFFNQGRFLLRIDGREIRVHIESEGFERTDILFQDLAGRKFPSIKVLHALIWLSLSGYVVDDYDAILASFFHGLRLFQEVWDEYT